MSITQSGDIRTGDVHVDSVLTNFAVKWGDPAFIADRVLPVIPVTKRSDKYHVWEFDSLRLPEADNRGEQDVAREIDFPLSTDTYFANDHALGRFLADQVRANADAGLAPAIQRAAMATQIKQMILRNWESEVATLLTTSGNYATDLYENLDSVANRNFDDSSGPGGIDIIQQHIDEVELESGGKVDTLWFASDTWRLLKSDSTFIPSLSATVVTTEEAIRDLFGVRQVLVARSLQNSAAKGADDMSNARLWTSNTMGGTIASPGATIDAPATGATFVWNAFPGSVNGQTVTTYRDAENRGGGGEWIEFSQYRDVKSTGVNSSDAFITAFLFDNVYDAI